jgi:SARP family transcriptional regulator, regulator of embCAB operon
LLHRGETLGAERLIDELWGERPPASAVKALRVHVARLRAVLSAGSRERRGELVVTRGHGYQLRLDPERLDAHRFERLVAEGRSELAVGRPERAVVALEEGLSLWRGRALDDLAYERLRSGRSPASMTCASRPPKTWSRRDWRWAATPTCWESSGR